MMPCPIFINDNYVECNRMRRQLLFSQCNYFTYNSYNKRMFKMIQCDDDDE